MQKQKKQFIIVMSLVLVFVAVFFGLQAFNKQQEEKEAEKQVTETITALTIGSEDIDGFTYQYDGAEISFEKEDDTWYLKSDHEINISQGMITTVLSSVETITAAQQITGVSDTSEYGFLEPQNTITLQIGKEANIDTVTITIGMYNEVTSQYYLMVSGSENVYLVDDSIYSAFQKSVEDLTEAEVEEEGS